MKILVHGKHFAAAHTAFIDQHVYVAAETRERTRAAGNFLQQRPEARGVSVWQVKNHTF
jgi:Cu2+-containing amine oxidase